MDEVGHAHALRDVDDGAAARELVRLDGDVRGLVHDGRILVRLDHPDQDVGALLADLPHRGHAARDGLSDHDHLHVRIGGETHELSNDGLLLLHEIVGVGDHLHVILAVLRHDHLAGAELVLALGDGPGHDPDLERDLDLGRLLRIGLRVRGAVGVSGASAERHREQGRCPGEDGPRAEEPARNLGIGTAHGNEPPPGFAGL